MAWTQNGEFSADYYASLLLLALRFDCNFFKGYWKQETITNNGTHCLQLPRMLLFF